VADALGDDPGTANVVVVGQGNVALDCARVLAKGARGLADTDIASYVFPVLKHGVKSTSIVGRRGHIQGAFTIKELRELTKLEAEGHETSFIVKKDELDMGSTPASEKELNAKGARPKVRIDKLLREAAANPLETRNAKEVHLRFLLNPARFEANETDSTKLGAVICERTKLEGEPGSQVAVGTGEFETIPAQLALISIGYKGVALPGIIESGLFDSQRGVVVNTHGKVDDSKDGLGGLYVSGWLKRGPSGIIGTNIADAKDTVASITKDLEGQTIKSHDTSLHYLLKERGVKVVDWSAYERIDATETDEARKRSREQPREKLTSIDEMLRAASL
jgi:adrenodoxin-NADP+ reductase